MGKKKAARELAALKKEVADLKTVMAHLRAEQGAKFKAEFASLHKKLHAELEQAKQRPEREEKEAKGEVQALEEKETKAKDKAKAVIRARMANIRDKSKASPLRAST
jgi:hypothetical protein